MSLRQDRVRELIKSALAEILRKEFSISEVGLLSIHEVAMGSDLKSATVFVGVLGGTDQRKKALEKLQAEAKFVQMRLAQAVILKYTPSLKFVLDDSIEQGNKVLNILDELDKKYPPAPDQPDEDE